MELESLRCRNCGAELNLSKAVNGVVKCEFCTSRFTLPKDDITPAALKFLHDGESSLYICRFDDAYAFYKKAAELMPTEPEAYWGMAISQFKVQYIKDEVNDRLQPVCHLITEESIKTNENYLKALNYATSAQRDEYISRADEIDYIKQEFFKLKDTGREYDCFICVKVTDDETKQRTADYKRADDIYFDLKGKGYNPFFSERELGDVTGADYEARILYALYTSECMIIVCSKEEYLHTKWVKNEYTRFLRLVGDEEKESDSVTIAFDGRPVEYLPGKNGKIQGIDLRSLNASEKITRFVESHTPEARAKKERAEQEKKEREASIMQEIEKQKQAQRELEERLKNLRENTSASTGASATTKSLLMRGNQFLAGEEYGNAGEYFNKVLDIDPASAEAWFGLLLSTNGAKDYKALFKGADTAGIDRILSNKNYRSAKQYAGGDFLKVMEEFAGYADEKLVEAIRRELKGADSEKIKRIIDNKNLRAAKENATGDFAVTVAELEKFANQSYINARWEESDAAWKAFLKDAGLPDISGEHKIYVNGSLVYKINGNAYLKKAYELADGAQRAAYDLYMAGVKKTVEGMKAEQERVAAEKQSLLDARQRELDEKLKKTPDLNKRRSADVGGKYGIIAGICAVLLFVLGLGGGCYSCVNRVPIFGDIIGDSIGSLIGFLVVLVLASAAGGAVVALIPLLLILLPSRSRTENYNVRVRRIEVLQGEVENLKAEIKKAKDNVSTYEKVLSGKTVPAPAKENKGSKKQGEKDGMTVFNVENYPTDGEIGGVLVIDVGPRKVDVIKIIRKYTGQGLVEAKNLADKGTFMIGNLPVLDAQNMVDELVEAGANALYGAGKDDN